ncbi:hypothetical protein [Actinacidiphila yeochonensis]|uniref:hypothetical protein n=1 Tax=Actinacidiphila yeochonensis TaxID=89050 RepID=UPI00055F7E32|nr:hypothetical protein [Actinacidiphila yeochonensis]
MSRPGSALSGPDGRAGVRLVQRATSTFTTTNRITAATTSSAAARPLSSESEPRGLSRPSALPSAAECP